MGKHKISDGHDARTVEHLYAHLETEGEINALSTRDGTKVILNFFHKIQAGTVKFAWVIRTSFAIMRLFFTKFRYFQHTFSSVE
jgi:hypothetical protein